jgi:hypothetical protein
VLGQGNHRIAAGLWGGWGVSVVMYCGRYPEMSERVIVVMSCER